MPYPAWDALCVMSTPVRAIGITHPDSPRHATFVAMLEALGLPYVLSPAVFVQGELPWSSHYDHATRMRNLGYPMRAGEVGCFLAHLNVWQLASRYEGCTLVLEDDAFVDPGRLREILTAADVLASKNMAARLISQPRPTFRTWREVGAGVSLARPTRPGNLTVGYLITQEGAGSLLKHADAFWCPVDDYMNLEYVHGCLMLHFEPEIAEHRDGGVSLIGKRTKPTVSLVTRVVREILRAWRNARGSLFSWSVLARLGLCFRRTEHPTAKPSA
jgi:glycosyl transferase family 25